MMPANQSTPEVTRAWEAVVTEFGAYMRDDWNGNAQIAQDAYDTLTAPPVEGLTSEEGWPAYGHWLPDAWDAYLRDLVGWEYMSGWAKLPATFRWSDFYDCLREHAPAASPKATATASVREGIARALYFRRNPVEYAENADFAWQCAKDHPAGHLADYFADADAVIATLTDSGTAATIGGERA